MQNSQKPHGFTLVELMVSIVIVAVLASFAVMFAKRGVQAAKASECISNMRQIQTGVESLTTEGVRTSHNPRRTYPPYAGQQQGPWNQFIWLDLVAEEMGLAEVIGSKYVWNLHPKDSIFQNPLSRHKLGGSGTEWEPLYGDKENTFGSFTWNNQMGAWVAAHTPDPLVRRASDVPYPALTILFGESDDDLKSGVPTACWGAGNAPQGSYKNGAHCMFVDGHTELIPNDHLNNEKWYAHYMGVTTKGRTGEIKKILEKPE
ncbi:type II secretion system protein [Haloferula chungangensis]|uniref:Type II secretion system protein n=1 Tax=Haloferula chungangensis TaxID=1048331 RepID=A0ABW2LEG5_9BACT